MNEGKIKNAPGVTSTKVTADIELFTDAKECTEEQLAYEFGVYMEESSEYPHGNIFSHKTGEDMGEINIRSFDLVSGVHFNHRELHLLALMADNLRDVRRMQDLDDHLGTTALSHEHLSDTLADVTVKITKMQEQNL